jgi:hypothetical protein
VKPKKRQSSRQQIAIQGVRDGVLQLPGCQYRTVLEVSSLNFELRSEQEQDVIIDTYESFLNSIGTGLQIVIRTRAIDLDTYLENLKLQLREETEAVYRMQLENYEIFIRSLITTNAILTKRFYVIIPFHASRNMDFDLVYEQLQVKADIVSKGLLRLGMHTKLLSSLEVLDLFYSFYSPAQAKMQPLTEQALHLLHTALIQKGDKNA